MRAPPLVPWLLAAVVASGCSTLFDYPRPRAESGSPACGDGIDNDLDGRKDCEDLDCATSRDCTRREDPADCRDGQDNDRDGYEDRADPLCWHLWASDPWEPCVVTRTVSFAEDFDAPAVARWFSNDPLAPRVVARPTDDGRTDSVAEVVPGPRAFSRSIVSSLYGELRITAAWLVPEGSEASLQIWSAASTASASEVRETGRLGEVRLSRTADGLALTVIRGDETSGPVQIPALLDEADWIPLVVDVRCGDRIEARAGDTVAGVGSDHCYGNPTFTDYTPLGRIADEAVRLAVAASAARVHLDDLAVSAVGTSTCDRSAPLLETGPGAASPPTSPRVLSMALSGDPERFAGVDDDPTCAAQPPPYLCALVLDQDTGFVEPWVSHADEEGEESAWPDLGTRFVRGPPLPPSAVREASVEWVWTGPCADPEEPSEPLQEWRAILRTVGGMAVYESPTCEGDSWTLSNAAVLPDFEDEWDWHAYFVRADKGDRRIREREEMYAARRGSSGLVFGRASRPLSTLSWTGFSVINGDRAAAEVADLTFPITLSRVGTTDQILTGHGSDLGLVVHVIPAGTGEEVLAWQGGGLNAFEYTGRIEPSGRPGSRDRWDVESGAVTVARQGTGDLYGLALYTADGDYGTPPGGHAPSVGIACRHIGLTNTPCETTTRSGPRPGDGFCFRNENCTNAPAVDCGYVCNANPNVQDLTRMASDRPEAAHPTSSGAFTWTGAETETHASALVHAGVVRSGVHFDVLLDGDSDACVVRLGVGHAAPTPDRHPVGEMAEVGLEGDLVRFRTFSRERDGTEARGEDAGRAMNNRGRWQHVMLLRTAEELQVWSGELDVTSNWTLRATAPRGPPDSSTLWIEVPGATGACRGRIRNVVVDEAQAPPP